MEIAYKVVMEKYRVVLQCYKHFEALDSNERAALDQIQKILGYDITLIAPIDLDVEDYGFRDVLRLPKAFFSYRGYNMLCMNKSFYQYFLDQGYEYMVLLQLDVWLFENTLDYFIRKFDEEGYDYIGAPWYGVSFGARDGQVGNGGFCIRRLSKFRDICRDYPVTEMINEDIYYCFQNRDRLKIAPEKLALAFSWEEKPSYCSKLTGGMLPMGTHAYASTSDRLQFWKDYISPIYEVKCVAGNIQSQYDNPNHVIGEADQV